MNVHRTIANRARVAALAVAAALLAGCGGGHFAALPSAMPANSSVAPVALGSSAVTFSIAPAAIEPDAASARSIALAVDPGPGVQPVTRDVAPGSSSSVVFSAAPGNHTFTFATYAGALGPDGSPQGRLLSQNAGIPFTVVSGVPAAIGIAPGGVPAAIAVLPAAGQDVRGTQSAGFDLYGFFKADGATKFDRTFTALTTNAANDLILGPGAPSIAMTSTDKGAYSDGVAPPENPSLFTVFALRYDPGARPGLIVTATPAAGTGNGRATLRSAVALRVAARNAPRVYVMDHRTNATGKVWVFDEQGNQIAVAGAFGGLDGGLGISYDERLNRLYVTNEFSNAITAYDPDGNTIATPGTFENLYFPLGVSVDNASHRVYAGNFNGGNGTGQCSASLCGLTVYDENGGRLSVAGGWRAREGVPGNLPYGVFADPGNARVYVADAGYGRVEAYDPSGNALHSWPAGDGAAGIAQDAATKNLYVTDDNLGVNVYDEQGGPLFTCSNGVCSGGPAGANAWKNLHGPIGIRQSPGNGWFYVANYSNNSVTAYDRDGNQMLLRGGNLAGGPFGFNGTSGVMQGPIGIEVVP